MTRLNLAFLFLLTVHHVALFGCAPGEPFAARIPPTDAEIQSADMSMMMPQIDAALAEPDMMIVDQEIIDAFIPDYAMTSTRESLLRSVMCFWSVRAIHFTQAGGGQDALLVDGLRLNGCLHL